MCAECGKKFVVKHKHKIKYCSKQCILNHTRRIAGNTNILISKICPICGKEFQTRRNKQIFCSNVCRVKNRYLKYNKKEEIEKEILKKQCVFCGKEFQTTYNHQIFCSTECSRQDQIKKEIRTELVSERRRCVYCGTAFIAQRTNQSLCGKKCYASYKREHMTKEEKKMQSEKQKEYVLKNKIKKQKKENYTNFGELLMFDEEQFVHWFKDNYVLFGIKKIIKLDRMFPDVIAETFDGKKLRIELELSPLNFIAHEHDANMCDLIICFVKPFKIEQIKGVPVISIFNGTCLKRGLTEYEYTSLELTDYFQNITQHCVDSLNKFLEEHKRE